MTVKRRRAAGPAGPDPPTSARLLQAKTQEDHREDGIRDNDFSKTVGTETFLETFSTTTAAHDLTAVAS